MAEKLIFIKTRYTEFDDKNTPGQKVRGYFIDFLSKEVNETGEKWKVLIESQFVDKSATALVEKIKQLVPGQYFNFDFNMVGRKSVVLSDIIPGELAVDFDSIL